MMLTRRTFLGQVAMSTLVPAVGRAADSRIERLGLQLYTVRTEMAKDFEGTLAKVAAAGYREVEFAGYFDKDPKNVRTLLDRHKLTAPSAHIDYPTVESKLDGAIDAARAVGHRFLVNP
jgi:sugar phosphate isomerase/epimerase